MRAVRLPSDSGRLASWLPPGSAGEGGQVADRFRQAGQLVAAQIQLGEGGQVADRFRQAGQLGAAQIQLGEGGEVADRFRQGTELGVAVARG